MRDFARVVLFSGVAAVLAAMSAVSPATAQQRKTAPPVKPYKAVAVQLPVPTEDPTFETFRNELMRVAKTRVYVELERLVTPQGFFWDRDFGGGFEAKKPGVDNLAAAIGLERRDGAGWGTLAMFAADSTAAPFTGRPGIICAPAEPSYDNVEFDRLVDATRSDFVDWAAPRADKTPVRAGPRANANVLDTLGLSLVRILSYQTRETTPEAFRAAWVRVATPAGKTGYVAPGAVTSLTVERLCYGKDGFARWRIAGFVGGGD